MTFDGAIKVNGRVRRPHWHHNSWIAVRGSELWFYKVGKLSHRFTFRTHTWDDWEPQAHPCDYCSAAGCELFHDTPTGSIDSNPYLCISCVHAMHALEKACEGINWGEAGAV